MPTDYALYLRKSRADLEAEAHGEGDTLARHEHILMELAKSRALPIGAIYREIVSGERIANRPVMQQLLFLFYTQNINMWFQLMVFYQRQVLFYPSLNFFQ